MWRMVLVETFEEVHVVGVWDTGFCIGQHDNSVRTEICDCAEVILVPDMFVAVCLGQLSVDLFVNLCIWWDHTPKIAELVGLSAQQWCLVGYILHRVLAGREPQVFFRLPSRPKSCAASANHDIMCCTSSANNSSCISCSMVFVWACRHLMLNRLLLARRMQHRMLKRQPSRMQWYRINLTLNFQQCFNPGVSINQKSTRSFQAAAATIKVTEVTPIQSMPTALQTKEGKF